MRLGRSLRHWLPPLAWMGLIFFLSAQPDLPHAPGPWVDTLLKKTGHALAYGVLTWLYWRALRVHARGDRTSVALRVASIGLAVAYALSDEYHQTLVPGRNGNLVDVAIDGVGACGAMLIARWLERRREMDRQTSAAR
jgi:VanZ family protein